MSFLLLRPCVLFCFFALFVLHFLFLSELEMALGPMPWPGRTPFIFFTQVVDRPVMNQGACNNVEI